MRDRRGVTMADIVPSPDEQLTRPDLRLAIIGLVALALFSLMVLRLFSLQVVNSKSFKAASTANKLRIVPLPAPRGLITDRNATVLVGNQVDQEIVLSRNEASNNPSVIGQVAALVGKSPKEVSTILNDPRYDPYQPAPVLKNAPEATIQYLEEHQSQFPGVSVQTMTTRSFPQGGSVAAQMIGYAGAISAAELKAHPNEGYTQASSFGKTGIESFFQPQLRGKEGTEAIQVNYRGEAEGISKVVRPVSGDTVVLNTDLGLQQALQSALEQQILLDRQTVDKRSGKIPPAPNGAAVVLDPHTGAILAMASYPTYDLSSWVGGISSTELKTILDSGALNNYAIQGLYTPGSTFKMITATAQLQNGLLSANQYINDTGTFRVPTCQVGGAGCEFNDDEVGGLGAVNLSSALSESSDYYFYNLGYLFAVQPSKYGTEPIQKVATDYGIGLPSGIDLPEAALGRIDSKKVRAALHAAAPKAYPNTMWYVGDNIEMAFGQGSTVVTPTEMATAYATFLNGGTRYAPRAAAGVVSPGGRLVKTFPPKVVGHVALTPSISAPILEGLLGVVGNPKGTAFGTFQQYAHFNMSQFPVGGKTGTASNAPGLEPNSWFVGFGPGGNPDYVVVCVIDQGGYGANAAAPVVANTFNYLVANPIKPVRFPTKQDPPSDTAPTSNPPAGTPPPGATTTTQPGA
ncbi:MAG: penicillin-binding transpeptidase domain-containing protein [Actinomycetes bacterium]